MGKRAVKAEKRPIRRSVKIWLPVALGVLVLGVLAWVAATIVPRALEVRDQLSAALPLAATVKASALTDPAGAQQAADEMRSHTTAAAAAASGGLWHALEVVPWAGANLSAVRIAAEEANRLTGEVILPAASVDVRSLAPVGGAIDVGKVNKLAETVSAARTAVETSSKRLDTIDESALLPPVRDAITQLHGELDGIRSPLAELDAGLAVLPGALGAEGPRNVLLLFQNNGEAMPGGGTVGSLALLHVENGRVDLVKQSSASPTDIPMYDEPIIDLPPGSRETYPSGLGQYVQNLTRTPRFSLTFEIAKEMWKRAKGDDVDTVVAIDTVALARIIGATGAIDLPGGRSLTAENAIPLLLGDLYQDYTPPQVDAINQAVAGLAFQRISSGQVSLENLAKVVASSAAEKRIRIWSDRPAEQKYLTGGPFYAEPPKSTASTDALGIYFIDYTPSKMQRFLTQSVDLQQAICSADGKRHERANVTLTNTVDPAVVHSLPDYVTGGGYTTPVGDMRLGVLAYAPPGSTMTGVSVDGAPVSPVITSDGDYPVNQTTVLLKPGQTMVVSFELIAHDDTRGKQLTADVTPLVAPTAITRSEWTC